MIILSLIVGFTLGYILALSIYYEPSKIRNYYIPCSGQKCKYIKSKGTILKEINDYVIPFDEEERRRMLLQSLKRSGLLETPKSTNNYYTHIDNKSND